MTQKALRVILILLSIICSYLIFLKVELFHMAGPIMVPILLTSILAFAIIIAKLRQFSAAGIDVETFLKNIFEQIERQRIKEAIELCDRAKNPIARILKAGIVKYDRPKDEIKEAMENSFLYELPLFEEYLPILLTIVQIAPLLGFVGTLGGIVKILVVIQAKAASLMPVNVTDLAPGIWEALLCTIAGFLVTIPVLIAYNYLTSRVKSFTEEIEKGAAQLLAFLLERRMSL